jgi:hypothetical protein
VKTVRRITAGVAAGLACWAAGCQQRMAEQPAPRAYEYYPAFPQGQSARPLEQGVVHRGQRGPDDPVVAWLTPAGRKAKAEVDPSGKAAYDPNSVVPPPGAPNSVDNFVAEFPFPMTAADLKRGQERYNIYCGVCHGATGYGFGKIVERGYLRPPSYHADPDGKRMDWSTTGEPSTELPMGYSRGFFRYGIKVPIREVPVGYIFQVITWGFGGMPDLAYQIPPEDRWRIIAYIRALQLSQGASAAELPPEAKAKLNGGGAAAPAKH